MGLIALGIKLSQNSDSRICRGSYESDPVCLAYGWVTGSVGGGPGVNFTCAVRAVQILLSQPVTRRYI